MAAVLVGILVFAIDPINRLEFKLWWIQLTTVGWVNGLWTPIQVPETASVDELIRASPDGRYPYRILESREIRSPGDWTSRCVVALVKGQSGKKLYLFRYEIGWGARRYDP